MSTIVTRAGKGVPLTATDHDNNVNNLNTDKVESLSDLGITATATELNYVDGVTSDIQTQIDGKQATIADDGLSGDKIDGGTISNFTSTGIDDNATSTAITINASENVGIGTSSPDGSLHVHTSTAGAVTAATDGDDLVVENSTHCGISILSNSTTNCSLLFGDVDDNNAGRIIYNNNNDTLALHVNQVVNVGAPSVTLEANKDVTVNSGNLVIGTSGKGIDFSADGNAAGMTSEVLDDYEEGIFTATLASGATTTPTTTGYYTKIGRRVNVLLSNDFGSVTVNGTALTISGLPFAAPASNTKARAAGAMGGTARVQHQAASESFWEIAEATSTLSAKYMLANAGGSTALLTEASGTYTPSYQVNISYIVD